MFSSGAFTQTDDPSAGQLGPACERRPNGDSHGLRSGADNASTSSESSGFQGVAIRGQQTDGARLPLRLASSELDNLNGILRHEVSANTFKNYMTQWNLFRCWATAKCVQCLPAQAAQVAAYLAERTELHGHKPATLRVAAAAIAFAHRSAGCEDPCSSDEVKRTLKAAARKSGRAQKQAVALTAEALGIIRTAACRPRPGRGGRLESPGKAKARGSFDIALISVMRDAMLRVSEAAALKWGDIHTEPDGTGRLLIRRSKTDPEGRGAVAFVSAEAMAALSIIKEARSGSDDVFALSPNQISRRIKQAAQAAGLGEGFSGHSPRVGMARDLVRAGIELPALMHAGRWRSPAMPAHYARNEIAGNNAVARFYGTPAGHLNAATQSDAAQREIRRHG